MLSHNGASILNFDFKLFGTPLECLSLIVLLNVDPRFPIERDPTVQVIWLIPINGSFVPSFSSISHSLSLSKENFLRPFPSFVDPLFLSYFGPDWQFRLDHGILRRFTRCFTFCPVEAFKAFGGKDGARGARDHGCGVR